MEEIQIFKIILQILAFLHTCSNSLRITSNSNSILNSILIFQVNNNPILNLIQMTILLLKGKDLLIIELPHNNLTQVYKLLCIISMMYSYGFQMKIKS
jgi:hypothetical protein